MGTKADVVRDLAAGTGCLGKSADDEPVFILVARDRQAAHAVRWWADQVAALLGASPKTEEAHAMANQMDAWREMHGGGKDPD